MAQKGKNIDPAKTEGLMQRRKEYAALTEELRLLELNYESAAAAVNMSADYFRNMSAKEGKPTAKAIALLRRYIDIQKKVHLHFRNKLPNTGNILNEDPAAYGYAQEMLTEMYGTLEYLKADADRRLAIEVNGDETLKRSVETTMERNATDRRKAFLERYAKSQKERMEKKRDSKSSGKKPKDGTPPPAIEGNNEPA